MSPKTFSPPKNSSKQEIWSSQNFRDLSQFVRRTPRDTPVPLYTRTSPWPTLAHRNRSDFCDLRLRCPSQTPEIATISETRESNVALQSKGCDGKSLAIYDFELRFLSPKPFLSAGFLVIWLSCQPKPRHLNLGVGLTGSVNVESASDCDCVIFWCAKDTPVCRVRLEAGVRPRPRRGPWKSLFACFGGCWVAARLRHLLAFLYAMVYVQLCLSCVPFCFWTQRVSKESEQTFRGHRRMSHDLCWFLCFGGGSMAGAFEPLALKTLTSLNKEVTPF